MSDAAGTVSGGHDLVVPKGHVNSYALDEAQRRIAEWAARCADADDAARRTLGYVVPFASLRVSPRNVTFVPASVPQALTGSGRWVPLARYRGTLPEAVLLRVVASIIAALLRLHAAGTCHGMLRLDAIEVDADALAFGLLAEGQKVREAPAPSTEQAVFKGGCNVRLGQFPLPAALFSQRSKTFATLMRCAAPEVREGKRVGAAADVWAVGAVLAELTSRSAQYTTDELRDFSIGHAAASTLSPGVVSLAVQCLKEDPDERATLAILATHPQFHVGSAAPTPRATPAALPPTAVGPMSTRMMREILRRRRAAEASGSLSNPTSPSRDADGAHVDAAMTDSADDDDSDASDGDDDDDDEEAAEESDDDDESDDDSGDDA